MFILPSEDVAGALSWLTTDTFQSLGIPALAVVLAGPGHEDLLQHLEEQCRHVDRESDNILILSLGTGHNPPGLFNPLWSFAPSNELACRIDALRQKLTRNPYRPGTQWGSFTDAAIRLLDLEPSCLPAVYLRFVRTDKDGAQSPAVVVPLPHARPELASRFLKQLSWEASDHTAGHTQLDAFLRDHNLFGWIISESTQEALDGSFRGLGHRLPRNVGASAESQRVQLAMDVAVTQSDGWTPDFSDIVSEADRFLAPRRKASKTTWYRPDLAIAMKLAATAHREEDYGTVVRTIGAVIEAFFSASLLHIVRGEWSVRLPRHLDAVDPDAGSIEVAGVRLNQPRKAVVGATIAATALNPWLAPPLFAGTQALERWLQEKALPEVNRASYGSIVTLLHEIADLRNPAAHGDCITVDHANRTWALFEHFMLSGQAAAMSAVRSGFEAWPHTDWTILATIHNTPRPQYERALHDECEASAAWATCYELLKSLHTRVRSWRVALDSLSAIVTSTAPSLNDLVTKTATVMVSSYLPGWAEVQAHVMSLTESDRQAKALARSAGRLFTTRAIADRKRLAEVSRALTPDTAVIRTPEDIDNVIKRIMAILTSGVVIPISESDWQPQVRRRLEQWIESLGKRDEAHRQAMPDIVRERARTWFAALEHRVRELQPAIQDAEERHAQAKVVLDCAAARLRAARSGTIADCRCGGHDSR
jgi:hypothetical protein